MYGVTGNLESHFLLQWLLPRVLCHGWGRVKPIRYVPPFQTPLSAERGQRVCDWEVEAGGQLFDEVCAPRQGEDKSILGVFRQAQYGLQVPGLHLVDLSQLGQASVFPRDLHPVRLYGGHIDVEECGGCAER